jgi:hypothetical protein
VPTIKCLCCEEKWELQPAQAGYFGSSAVQPHAWFSQQLLECYTVLSASGTSIGSMAAAVDKSNGKPDAHLTVDAR